MGKRESERGREATESGPVMGWVGCKFPNLRLPVNPALGKISDLNLRTRLLTPRIGG